MTRTAGLGRRMRRGAGWLRGLSLPTTSWTKGTPATVMDASNPLRAMHDALVRAGLALPNGMSNWLGVTARNGCQPTTSS